MTANMFKQAVIGNSQFIIKVPNTDMIVSAS